MFVIALVVATPSVVAAAESPWPDTVEIGVRVGYAVPAGKAAQQLPMRDALKAKVPLILEGGYRFRDRFYLGGYVEYAYGAGTPRSRLFCPQADPAQPRVTDTNCSMRDIRFGAMAAVHFAPHATVDPWLGFGMGYEVLTRQENNTSVRGWEFLNLHGGADFALASDLVIGPFVSASFARYSLSAWTTQYFEDTATIPDPATHVWISFGLRAAFRPVPSPSS